MAFVLTYDGSKYWLLKDASQPPISTEVEPYILIAKYSKYLHHKSLHDGKQFSSPLSYTVAKE